MIRLNLTDADRELLAEALDDPEFDDRTKRKLMVVRMHDLKAPHGFIAKSLNLSKDTVTNYLKLYQAGGLDSLLENRHFRPVSQAEPFFDQIRLHLDQNPVATGKEAAARIKAITGIGYSVEQARRILKKLGFKCRKTASVPGKADGQLQFDFLNEELAPRLEEARQGRRRVFFVDAAHFVHGCFLGLVWCLSRMIVPSASGRRRYNVLAAVETRDLDFVSVRTTESVNAATVCELMAGIARRCPGEAITLVLDNARYQYNHKVMAAAAEHGLELLYLPAYSPNLNLIERVWRLVKSGCLRNKYYETFDAFRAAIDAFIDSLGRERRAELRSLLTENFHIPGFPK